MKRHEYANNRERMLYLLRRHCVGEGRDPIHYGRQPRPDRGKNHRRR